MSVSDVIPVETVNKDDDHNVHENAKDEEDDEPPSLREREVDDDDESLKQDQASIGIRLI